MSISNFFNKNKAYIFFAFLVVLVIAPSLSHSAMIDPSFRFRSLETDHFVIHYHQGIAGTAGRVARISEDVHASLAPDLMWTPSEKTQVVLIDNSDFANGLATVLPYNAIYIFVVPPLSDMSISDYEDWLEMVIIHEYVHILTMDPVRGYSSVMRKVFGKTLPGFDPLSALLFFFTAPPNIFMPGWWHEGMSTWAETELTNKGRGRSTYYEMIYRMDVAEENIPRIDELNGDVPDWPGFSIRYIYGSILEKHIEKTYGKDKLGKINITQAGRFPYFINATPRRFTGKNYVYQYKDLVRELKDDQGGKIEKLKSAPLTRYRTLPIEGERITNPRISPDGRYIAVNRRDPNYHEDIVIVDANTLEEVETVRRLVSDHSLSWSPDGKKLYFTQANLRGGFNLYQDIYVYDVEEDDVDRVTRNARSKDIDVSPDGHYIVFIKVETLKQSIAILQLDSDEKEEIVVDYGLDERGKYALSGPRWSRDGRSIVYSRRDDKGNTYLELLDMQTKDVSVLVSDGHNNIYPTWSPDGKFILFTSDRTGVYNLYALSRETGEIRQVTHVLGGAFQSDISTNKERIVLSYYHSRGYRAAEIPYDPAGWNNESGPVIQAFWDKVVAVEKERDETHEPAMESEATKESIGLEGDRAGEQTVVSPKPADPVEQEDIEIKDKGSYSAFPTLTPRFWLPTLMFDHEGAVPGAFTAGQDVLGYHTYILNPAVGFSGELYGDATYVYSRWYPSFFLSAYSLPLFYSEFFDDYDDYYERKSSVSAGIIVPLNYLESNYSLLAGYEYEERESLTDIEDRTVDGLEVFEGRRDNIFIGFRYNGALKYPYSISHEEGRNISLLYRDYIEDLGSELDQREYSAEWEEYIGLFLHHTLYMNLKGATSEGDRIAQQAFQLGGTPVAGNRYPLRGFDQGFETGKHIVTGNFEYRFPVKYMFRGWSTKPFFFDSLHMATFVDAGNVWGDGEDFEWDDFSVGIGVEVRLDMVLGYHLKITPAAGIAQGITDDGETQVYITIYADL